MDDVFRKRETPYEEDAFKLFTQIIDKFINYANS